MTNGAYIDSSPVESDDSISLYVHIPFCKTKCGYCDFNTYQGIEVLMRPYLGAICDEIKLWGKFLSHPKVNTVFFGGGTPSYLSTSDLADIMASICQSFELDPKVEISVEANPDDINHTKMEYLLGLGVNRLSIGMQSFDDTLLKMLGRRHTAADAQKAFMLSRETGFQNINIDLMYGLPTQTFGQWQSTLDTAIDMSPEHISLYALTIEDGTPMQRMVSDKLLPSPDQDLAADMYYWSWDMLSNEKYYHYEISNWALPGFKSDHNMTYWENGQYLGVGPGAHSQISSYRFWNLSSPRSYIKAVENWVSRENLEGRSGVDEQTLLATEVVSEIEIISTTLRMAETMFLGLRLLDGIDIKKFRTRFGYDPLKLYKTEIVDLCESGLLVKKGNILKLTQKGCLLSNQVFVRFL